MLKNLSKWFWLISFSNGRAEMYIVNCYEKINLLFMVRIIIYF